MGKIDIVKMNAEAASAYHADPAKNVGKLVRDVLSLYTKTAIRLHHAACITLYHAATTGDTRPLNNFFNGLRQNDKDALRLWVGKAVTFEHDPEDGTDPVEKKFITFTKDKGFGIVKGTEAVREGHFDLGNMLAGKSFMDMDQAKETKAFGLAELLALLAAQEKKMTKKAEENGIELPPSLKAALADMSHEATKIGNTLGKVAVN